MPMLNAFKPTTIISDFRSMTIFQSLFLVSMIVVMLGLSYYWQDSAVSVVSGVTGVICVFMVNMRKLSNFAWGAINCTLYGYVAYTASYFGDTMLNWIFYLPIQFIGAYMWSKQMEDDTVVSRKVESKQTLLAIVAFTIATVLIYSQALSYIGGKLSIIDATTTTLSILATYFMVKGYREQWVCWVIVNVLSIYMWTVNFLANGDGYGVLIMWIMFLTNSLYGYYTWFKASKNEQTTI